MDSDLIEFSEELKAAKELLKEWEICKRGGMEYGRFSAESKMPEVLGNLVNKIVAIQEHNTRNMLRINKKKLDELHERQLKNELDTKTIKQKIEKSNKRIDCWMRGCSYTYEITPSGFKAIFRHKKDCPNIDYEM